MVFIVWQVQILLEGAGYKDGQNKAALNSIKAGLTDDIIARITDLSLDEIKKLRTTIV